MTLEEALNLRDGDTVTHRTHVDWRGATPVQIPLRVTKVWTNTTKTVVQLRINKVGGDQWLDALAYDLPPKGKVYDRIGLEWITPAELEARQKARQNARPTGNAA